MSLSRAAHHLRASVLHRISIPAVSTQLSQPLSGSLTLFRGFAESTYLDKSQVTERILSVVKNFDKVDGSKVSPTAHFQNDLGLDSLDTVEVVMAFEEEFAIEIPDNEADKILSTSDAISYIAGHPHAK